MTLMLTTLPRAGGSEPARPRPAAHSALPDPPAANAAARLSSPRSRAAAEPDRPAPLAPGHPAGPGPRSRARGTAGTRAHTSHPQPGTAPGVSGSRPEPDRDLLG